MTETQTPRRHPDGSIDFDFYRIRAGALREAAMRDNTAAFGVVCGWAALSFVMLAVLTLARPVLPATQVASAPAASVGGR